MNSIRRYLKNKKGINTILAALLMVVIVVVASVMVYAWSTGLLGTLLVQPQTGKEALSMDSYSFPNATQVTIYVRNAGSVAVSLQSYYVKDSSGNQWQNTAFSPAGQPVAPNTALGVTMGITTGNGCGSSCVYTGSANAFNTFTGGYSYTVLVVTTRNNQFSFTVTK